MTCAVCGGDLETGDAFCGHCGAPRPAGNRECPTCHEVDLEPDDHFCGRCGTPLASQTAAPVASKIHPRLHRTFSGHTNSVASVAFSPDGVFALSSGTDHTVRLWDLESGQEVQRYVGHEGFEVRCALGENEEQILSLGDDCSLRIWDRDSAQEVRRITLDGPIYSSAFSTDGRLALTGHNGFIQLWDVERGTKLRLMLGHTDIVTSVAFWSDGLYALSGAADGTMRLWSLERGVEIRSHGHGGKVNAACFDSTGELLVSAGGMPAKIRLWDGGSGKLLRELEGVITPPRCIALSPDGRLLLASQTGKVVIWDPRSGRRIGDAEGHTQLIWSLAISPDGGLALSGGGNGTVCLWQLPEV